jgi:short-subunit dehydrogenase
MVARRSGRVLNVASTAAFFSGPLMATYYATKNYVLAFSEAIAEEVAASGVTVTALCPGPTASGFQARAAMEGSKLLESGVMDAPTVAREGWAALKAGKRVVVPGFRNRVSVLSPRLLPRRVATRIVLNAQRSRHGTS